MPWLAVSLGNFAQADQTALPWPANSVWLALLYFTMFGLVGIGLTMLGIKVFDWITPKINVEEELAEKQNIAVAIVCAAIIIGICLILTRAMS